MDKIVNFIKGEPSLVLQAVQAILALAMGFGLNVTTEQMALILTATSAVIAIATRQSVTPNSTLKGNTQ